MSAHSRPDTSPTAQSAPHAAPAKVSRGAKAKRVLLLLLGGLVALAIAYGAGRLQSAGVIKEADQQRIVKEDELATERQRSTRLEARRRLHLALIALDERNFGIAQTELSTAGKLLGSTNPPANAALAKLASELQTFKLTASDDLSVQRQRLLGWARDWDAELK